jgi:diguanylate cyclase (GGDEF)-like protein
MREEFDMTESAGGAESGGSDHASLANAAADDLGGLPETAIDWPVGVARCAADGAIRALNPAAAEMLARFGPDPIARNLFAQLRDAAPDLRAAAAQASARRGRLVRKLRRRGVGATATLLFRAGTLTVLLTDDTAQLRAEEEAERHRARFAALADAPRRGAAFAIDPRGRISSWSASAQRFEGLTAPEALGMPLEALMARASFPLDAQTLIEAAARAGEATVGGVRAAPGRAPLRLSLTLRAVRGARAALDGFVVMVREDQSADAASAELRFLADTDALTGVLNRRAFEEAACAAAAAADAQRHPCALILIDVDRFKDINDARGHGAGDAALRALAEALREGLRGGDVIGRLGGDEFALLLPRADLDRATQIAGRLREAVRALRPVYDGEVLRLTASFGLTEAEPAETLTELMHRADAALYRAKAGGRDRVVRA